MWFSFSIVNFLCHSNRYISHRFMGKRRHFRSKKSLASQSSNSVKEPVRRAYKDIVKENANFEKYYKTQQIVPSDEWDNFMKSLRENLPATFRITGYRGQAKALLSIIRGKYFEDLLKIKEDTIDQYKPFPLPWYPEELAWQMKLSRVTIRSSEGLRKLHNFLVSETETGNISRQETVSMISPLLLNVKSHHKVLDMCAAPGSKTAQLIEFLHKDEEKIPDGLIVANDLDNKRCYMLVHQAKRLNSPCLIITNNDAANFPNIKIPQDGKQIPVKFDKILCDVPCSGDGTIRKTLEIWNKWNAANGNNMHGLQLRILRRGLELLAIGGQIVYSTCSLNPLENEAVLSTILQEAKGSVELVNVSSTLQGLKYIPGMTSWKVANKELQFFEKFEEVPEKNLTHIRPHMFPPSPEIIKDLHLEKCVRILPHHQDTGGFFVALLQKNDNLPWEKSKEDTSYSSKRSPPQKKRKIWGYKEDPFIFFEDSEEIWPRVREFYDLKDFPVTQILSRCKEGKKRNLYFTSEIVKKIVQNNVDIIKIINTGVRILCRSENKDATCSFRLTQEGIATVLPFMHKRMFDIGKEDLIVLLTNEYPPHSSFTAQFQKTLLPVESGCLVLSYTGNKGEEDEFRIELCGWKGNQTIRCYVPKVGRAHYLRIVGYDVTEYEMREKKKFKVKDSDAVTDEVSLSDNDVKDEASVSDNDVKDEMTDEASAADNDQAEVTNNDALPSEIEDDIKALPEQKNGIAIS